MLGLTGFDNLTFLKKTFKVFSLDCVAYGFVLLLPFSNILLAASWFQKVVCTTGTRVATLAKLMLAFLVAAFMPSK